MGFERVICWWPAVTEPAEQSSTYKYRDSKYCQWPPNTYSTNGEFGKALIFSVPPDIINYTRKCILHLKNAPKCTDLQLYSKKNFWASHSWTSITEEVQDPPLTGIQWVPVFRALQLVQRGLKKQQGQEVAIIQQAAAYFQHIEDIMGGIGAQNFSFAHKFPQNGDFNPKFCTCGHKFSEKNKIFRHIKI